jgi:hypothetical protein
MYVFETTLANRPFHRVRIPARTDLEAMTIWCGLPAVQNWSHTDVIRTTIESYPIPG